MSKYAVVLSALAMAIGYGAIAIGGLALLLLWLATDFLILAAAYAMGSPRIFGKRADGTLPLWSWLLFLPYHLLNLTIWHASRLASAEPASNTVGDTLVVSRRLLSGEATGEFQNLLDLTAEFEEPKKVRNLPGYTCLPVLDATAPDFRQLHETICQLKPGRTLIHCAQGHGRTGLAALAFLLSRGLANDVDGGIEQLQNARPRIRLNSGQRRSAEAYAAYLLNHA